MIVAAFVTIALLFVEGEGNQVSSVIYRCYTAISQTSYDIPDGFTESDAELQQKYELFLQTVGSQVPSGCDQVSLTLGQIAPQENSSVDILAEIVFTADSSVDDQLVDTNISLCINTVAGLIGSLTFLAPSLTDENGTTHQALFIDLLLPAESCCGEDPPPCTVQVTSSVMAPSSAQGSSTASLIEITPSMSSSYAPNQANFVVKKCYLANATLSYTIPEGYIDTQAQLEQKYGMFLETISGQRPPQCVDVSLTLGQISPSLPEDPNVEILSEIIFTANSIVPDQLVETTLVTCISAVDVSISALILVAPSLIDGTGDSHQPDSIDLLPPRSCCGDDPPPCTVQISSVIPTVSTQVSSSTVFSMPVPSTSIEGGGGSGNFVTLKCYSVPTTTFYTIPGFFTETQEQLLKKYEFFITTVQGQVPNCNDVILSLKSISSSPPSEEPAVQIFADILFTADDSVPDSQVDSTLLLCIGTVESFESFIQAQAPQLTGLDDSPFSATGVQVMNEESCCGVNPPPCSLLVTVPISSTTSPEFSSSQTSHSSLSEFPNTASVSGSLLSTRHITVADPRQVFTVIRRCYTLSLEISYPTPTGTDALSENYVRTTYEPLLQQAINFIPQCINTIVTLEQISFTEPDEPDVRISGVIVATADNSIADADLDLTLSSCTITISGGQSILLSFLPGLLGKDGMMHAADAVTFGVPESCCGVDPLPCTVTVTSFIGPVNTATASSSTPFTPTLISPSLTVTSVSLQTQAPSFSRLSTVSFVLSQATANVPGGGGLWQVFTDVRRCYTMSVELGYNTASGTDEVSEDYVRSTFEPLLQQAKFLVQICSSVTFSLEQISFTEPDEPDVRINAVVVATAENSIADADIDFTLSSCTTTIKGVESSLLSLAPPLLGKDGQPYFANLFAFGNPESCCGVDPLPCTLIVSSFIAGNTATASMSSHLTPSLITPSFTVTGASLQTQAPFISVDGSYKFFAVVKRCYTVYVELGYATAQGTDVLSEEYVRSTFEPPLEEAKNFIFTCRNITFSFEQIAFTNPDVVNVNISAVVVAEGDNSTDDLDSIISLCVGTIRAVQLAILENVPGLLGSDGVTYEATSIVIGVPESCCGVEPLPCTVTISSLIVSGPTTTQKLAATISPLFVSGFGTFEFHMNLYRAGSLVDTSQGPVAVTLKEQLVIEVGVSQGSLQHLRLYLERCWVTPTEDSNHEASYVLISEGCEVSNNRDAVNYNCSDNVANVHRFDIKVFRFLPPEDFPVVYIHCDVMVCSISSEDFTCDCPDCGGVRRKRLVPNQAEIPFDKRSRVYELTIGPIVKVDTKTKKQDAPDEAQSERFSLITVIVGVVSGFVVILVIVIAAIAVGRKRHVKPTDQVQSNNGVSLRMYRHSNQPRDQHT